MTEKITADEQSECKKVRVNIVAILKKEEHGLHFGVEAPPLTVLANSSGGLLSISSANCLAR